MSNRNVRYMLHFQSKFPEISIPVQLISTGQIFGFCLTSSLLDGDCKNRESHFIATCEKWEAVVTETCIWLTLSPVVCCIDIAIETIDNNKTFFLLETVSDIHEIIFIGISISWTFLEIIFIGISIYWTVMSRLGWPWNKNWQIFLSI